MRNARLLRPLRLLMFAILLGSVPLTTRLSSPVSAADDRLDKLARQVTIHRDKYGVPHVYGPTDQSVIFGFMYAQAEDNFWQLEEDHINKLGRASEIYGNSRLLGDLMNRLFETNQRAKTEYNRLTPQIRV